MHTAETLIPSLTTDPQDTHESSGARASDEIDSHAAKVVAEIDGTIAALTSLRERVIAGATRVRDHVATQTRICQGASSLTAKVNEFLSLSQGNGQGNGH